jgi:hypothetical protein
MSQTYEQRRATVERALATENINPGKGKDLIRIGDQGAGALDGIKEDVR